MCLIMTLLSLQVVVRNDVLFEARNCDVNVYKCMCVRLI